MTEQNNEPRLILCIYCEKKKNPDIHPYLRSMNQKCNECHAILGEGIG